MNSLTNISDISRYYYHYLFTHQNVRGVGVGYKFINGIQTNELCLHVLVTNKIDKAYLSYNNIIPPSYMGIKTDVIEVGNPKISGGNSSTTAFPSQSAKQCRPLQGGCHIYTKGSSLSGTLGCIVVRKSIFGDKYFILSNNHVLADENSIALGTKVIEPPPSEGGTFDKDKDVVAKLSKFIALKFPKGTTKGINSVDCAIAEITNKSFISNKILKIGAVTGSSKAILGEPVKKTGAVSGLSSGKIISVATTMMDFDFGSKGKLSFVDQIMALLPSTQGDSGSVVLNKHNQAVGLLFATGKLGVSFLNDINLVLKKLDVKIYK